MTISNKAKAIGRLIFGLFLLITLFSMLNTKREMSSKIQALQEQNSSLQSSMKQSNSKYDQLSKQYDELNKEKNGSANESLISTTNELFKLVYNYNTDKKSDSLAARKGQAKPFANSSALDSLFSKNAEDWAPSVSTISKLEERPQIYRMSSDDKNLTALVLIDYSVSIAESKPQKGELMYRLTFDPVEKIVSEIKLLGEISVTQ